MAIGVLKATCVRTPSGRYDLKFQDGVEIPTPPDITIATIPDFALTAGAAFSQNFNAYASGVDLPGATYAIEEISGTLAALDLTFSTSTLSDATPTEGSAIVRLAITKSGYTIRSNNFALVCNPAPITDNVSPTEVFGLSVANITATRNDITVDWPSDVRTSSVNPTDPVKIVIERNVDGGAFTTLTTLTASSSQPTPAMSFTAIGSMSSPSATPNGPDVSLTVADGLISTASDVMAFYGGLVSGNFEIAGKMPSITSGYAWSTAGVCIRQNRLAMSAGAFITERTATNAAGAPMLMRASQGAAITYTADASVAAGTPVKIKRVGNLLTYQTWNTTTFQWDSVGSATIVMTDPVEAGAHAERSAAGAAITVNVPQIRINALGTASYSDTSVSAGHVYGYRARARDSATIPNESAVGATTFVSTEAARKWFPGWIIMLDNFMESATNRALHLNPTFNQASNTGHIIETASMPNVTGIKVLVHWGFLEAGTTVGNATYTNFDIIQQYLDRCQEAGKKLILSVFPISFGNGNFHNGSLFPQYISEDPTNYGITTPLSYGSGAMARTWRASVNERLCLLHEAIAAEFDSHPAFGGVQTEETSINLANGTDGFTYALYTTALKEQIDRMTAAFRTSQVRTSTNFFNGGDASGQEIIAHCALRGCGVGGPDVIPRESIASDRIFTGYTGGIDYRGAGPYGPGIGGANIMPSYGEIQWDSLGSAKEGNFTMLQLYNNMHYGTCYASATPPPGPEISVAGVRPRNVNYSLVYRNTTNISPYRLMWNADIKPFINSHVGYGSSVRPVNQ